MLGLLGECSNLPWHLCYAAFTSSLLPSVSFFSHRHFSAHYVNVPSQPPSQHRQGTLEDPSLVFHDGEKSLCVFTPARVCVYLVPYCSGIDPRRLGASVLSFSTAAERPRFLLDADVRVVLLGPISKEPCGSMLVLFIPVTRWKCSH